MSLESLLDVKIVDRDFAWEVEFLKGLGKGHLIVSSPEPVPGPDGWPYLMAKTQGAEEAEPTNRIVRWLAERGVGLVINPEKPMPDFVLTYGMVWNFRERGEFLTMAAAPRHRSGAIAFRNNQQIYTGPPSRSYLPDDVRAVLREFFARQRVTSARVLMISEDQVNWDLAFSLESLGQPPASEHAQLAEALSWFLPAHYSVALVSETIAPGFVEL